MFKLKLQLYRHTLLSHFEEFLIIPQNFGTSKLHRDNHPVDLQRIWYGKIACLSQWKQGLFHFLLIDLVKLIIQLSLLLELTKRSRWAVQSQRNANIHRNETHLKFKGVSFCTSHENSDYAPDNLRGPFQKGDSEPENHCFRVHVGFGGVIRNDLWDVDGVVSDTRVFIKESEHPGKGNR